MNRAAAGRLIAVSGVLLGFLAIWLPAVHRNGLTFWYDGDGTTVLFLLIILAITFVYLFNGDEDFAAVLGAIALGFFLFIPATHAVGRLGELRVGSWLGLYTVLIPAGLLLAGPTERPPGSTIGRPSRPAMLTVAAGVTLCLVGLPLTAWSVFRESRSVWSLSSSDHGLGVLVLTLSMSIGVFVVAMIVDTASASRYSSLARVAAGVICGLGSWMIVYYGFAYLGFLGLGAWVEAFGGVVLLAGTLWLCRTTEVAESSSINEVMASRRVESSEPAGVRNRRRLLS